VKSPNSYQYISIASKFQNVNVLHCCILMGYYNATDYHHYNATDYHHYNATDYHHYNAIDYHPIYWDPPQ
jgi:hypothetical protein